MKPKFPILQIEEEWKDVEMAFEMFWHNEYYYSSDDIYYKKYVYKKRFLDSNGNIFIAKEKIKHKDFWSIIGIRKKFKINFEETFETWSFYQVKELFLLKIKDYPHEETKLILIKSYQKAKTIKELFEK